MLDDAADVERVIEDLHGVADMVALVTAGGVVVDDDVVRALKGTAGEELEGAKGVVAGVIDAEDAFDRAGGVELRDHRGHHGDVGQFSYDIRDFGGHRRAPDGGEEAGVRRLNHHVRPDAEGAGAAAAHLADEDSGDGEDHDDFYGNSQHADGYTDRPVEQVAENQLVHRASVTKQLRGTDTLRGMRSIPGKWCSAD